MKILIGYDGSSTAEAALDDLKLAGMPSKAEAIVMSVAEFWLPPETIEEGGVDVKPDPYLEQFVDAHRQKARKAVSEAELLARKAGERLRKMFPNWKVESEATYGSPAWEIIAKANEIKADLIVVGSHGRTAVGRLFLGSISQKVLTEADCSVRVARGRIEIDPAPSRIVIGFDSSPGAQVAVETVASRNWGEGSEVCLVAVTDPVMPSPMGFLALPIENRVAEANQGEHELLEKIAAEALQKLRDAGLSANLHFESGNPKQVLVEEAMRWHANSIFVGANLYGSRLERFLLGSVSAAVAARAHCSVEVVRKKQ